MGVMRYALFCLLVPVSVSAQSTARLDADLMMALSNPNASLAVLSNQVTDDILALADKTAAPSRQTTLEFSLELTKVLATRVSPTPKLINSPSIESVTGPLFEVLQSSGTTSAKFHASIEHFRAALIGLKVEEVAAKKATAELMILGQEVHGPEDDRRVPLALRR
jgi:hypothetical protein